MQYRALTETWRFAENQLEYMGSGNCHISSYYEGWIDLFINKFTRCHSYSVWQLFLLKGTQASIPVFHFNHDRIKAHISICFVALKVYRELDRMLKNNKMTLSVDTVLNIAKTIPTISVRMSENTLTKTLFLTKRQEQIKPLLEEKFWVSQNCSENQ